jgi:polysaccharide biosynthesis transport protein
MMRSRLAIVRRGGLIEIRFEANDAELAAAVSNTLAAELVTEGRGTVRWISPARASSRPVKPDMGLLIAAGLAAGLLSGISWSLLGAKSARRMYLPGDAAAIANVRELGAIPRASNSILKGFREIDSPVERLTWEQKDSAFSAAFHGVIASAMLPQGCPRVVVVTSPKSGEGKTTVASNLAIALAETGRRVLLVDGDLRRPRLHLIFDVVNSPGLSESLETESGIGALATEKLVSRTALPNLHLLPSGPGPDSIFGRLCSPLMQGLFSRLRERYDHIVVDAPPSLDFPDARILAAHADGAVLVFGVDRTTSREANGVVAQFLQDRIPLIGVVLNGWKSNWAPDYAAYDPEMRRSSAALARLVPTGARHAQ